MTTKKKSARKLLDQKHREFKQQKKSLEQEIRNLKRKYKKDKKELQSAVARERKEDQQKKILSPQKQDPGKQPGKQSTPGNRDFVSSTSAQKLDELRQQMRLKFSGFKDDQNDEQR